MNIIRKSESDRFYLGSPCKRGHKDNAGKNLRYKANWLCVACTQERNRSTKPKLSAIDRFWQKVEKTDTCWNWTGCRNRKGYGELTVNRKPFTAHRFIWMHIIGDIPPGMFVCHRCDNPRCVRIDHLFLGTPQDNTDDMMAKQRHKFVVKRGSDAVHSKFTESQIREIRLKYATGEYNQTQLGKEYKTSPGYISNIVRGRVWGHLS